MKQITTQTTNFPDQDIEPLMTLQEIRQNMPPSYHTDKVDKVLAMDDSSIVAMKCITNDEPFFMGHFPGEPVLPGVYQIESMVQSAAILIHNQRHTGENFMYFLSDIVHAKFRQKVVPGDTLVMHVTQVTDLGGGKTSMKGECHVGSRLVSEATFVIQEERR